MDFRLSEEQAAIKEMAHQFSENELLPHAAEWDEKNIFPVDTLKKAAELGLAGIYVKGDVGGSELSRLDATLIFEELSRACPSTAAYLSIHNMVAWAIDNYANEQFRLKWLPKLTSMELLSSYCLTEPSSGSDAASLKTTAKKNGSHYVLNGSKAFISGGSVSDIYIVMARTGEAGPKGISCILVDKNSEGLTFGKKEQKLGWNSQPTTMVFFENCRVPIENLIGEEGKGFNIALNALNGGRLNIASCSLGGAMICFEQTRQYMLERKQFGKKIADFQALQFRMSDMLTELETARLIVHKAAYLLDNKDPQAHMYCAMAKRHATDACFNICNNALQLFGGYGYLKDYPIERYFRDLRVHQILEGTNEIMRMIISRQIFSDKFNI